MTECTVWPMIVVVDPPGFDLLPGLIDRPELVNVQAFIAQPPVERFAQPIIRGLSGPCKVQQHTVLPCPLVERP
jgi:hypothetical protein